MKVGDLVEWYETITMTGWDKSYDITELKKRSGVIVQLSNKNGYAIILDSGCIRKKKTKKLRIISEALQPR